MFLLNLSDLLRRENPGSQVAMLRYVPALKRSSQGHGAVALGGDTNATGSGASEVGLMPHDLEPKTIPGYLTWGGQVMSQICFFAGEKVMGRRGTCNPRLRQGYKQFEIQRDISI